MKRILVTGAAGFIGTNLIAKLIKSRKYEIFGVDNLNAYYNPDIKNENLASNNSKYFTFKEIDILDENKMKEELFEKYHFDIVVHLAAQPGVQYSVEHPITVIQNNIQGFENIIRLSYEYGADKFLFASSSSVLGDGGNVPKSTYGVTKATNELQAKMYSQFFPEMNITGLRLYTVYGERMRPDLAIAKFTDAILNNGNITVNGDGGILRDFTYIGDVTDAFKVAIESDVKNNGKIYDIGNGTPISIMELINIMKKVYNKPDFNNITYKEENIHDMQVTNSKGGKQMEETFGFKCKVGIEEGLEKYKEFIEK